MSQKEGTIIIMPVNRKTLKRLLVKEFETKLLDIFERSDRSRAAGRRKEQYIDALDGLTRRPARRSKQRRNRK